MTHANATAIHFRASAPASTAQATSLSRKQLIVLHLLLVVLVAVVETRAMWAPAVLWGDSAWFDLVRMVEFDAAVRAGNYLPAWLPDLYHGYGSPLFQFYSPLVYFAAEVPVLIGLGIPTALKCTLLLTLIASGLAMYQFAARHVSRWAACLAAILFMVAPYRLVDLFERHALAEHAAFLWLPLLVDATERFASTRSRAGLVGGTVAAAGLVLTHNIMALIALPACVAAGCLLASRGWHWCVLLRGAVPAVLGVGVAAFFWLPALSGRALTHAEESLTAGHFDYHRHFVAASTLIGAGSEWETTDDDTVAVPLNVGFPHVLALVGVLFLAVRKRRTRWCVVAVMIGAGALFMCHPSSRLVWDTLPLVRYVQFPWRFLALVIFGAAMGGAALLHQLHSRNRRLEVPVFLAAVVTVVLANAPYFSTPDFLVADNEQRSFVRATSDGVEAMGARGRLMSFDELVTPITMRGSDERATSKDDFLPRTVQEKPGAPATLPFSTADGQFNHAERVGFNTYRAEVAMRTPGAIALHQFWFPGWIARVDGRLVDAAPTGKMAIVSCAVPAGEHVVEFRYTALPQRNLGLIISSLCVAASAALAIGSRRGLRTGGLP